MASPPRRKPSCLMQVTDGNNQLLFKNGNNDNNVNNVCDESNESNVRNESNDHKETLNTR